MAKKKVDFTDLSSHDAVALVMNTAVVARESGHPVQVSVATRKGEEVGILIWMPGFIVKDGVVVVRPSSEDGGA